MKKNMVMLWKKILNISGVFFVFCFLMSLFGMIHYAFTQALLSFWVWAALIVGFMIIVLVLAWCEDKIRENNPDEKYKSEKISVAKPLS